MKEWRLDIDSWPGPNRKKWPDLRDFIHAVKLVFTRKSDYSLYSKNRKIHQGFCFVPEA